MDGCHRRKFRPSDQEDAKRAKAQSDGARQRESPRPLQITIRGRFRLHPPLSSYRSSSPISKASFPLPHLLKHTPRRSDQHHHQNSMNEWSTLHARIIYHHFRNINTGRIPRVDLLHAYPYTLVESYCDV